MNLPTLLLAAALYVAALAVLTDPWLAARIARGLGL